MSRVLDTELEHNPLIVALLAQLPVGVAIASRDGEIAYTNDIASALGSNIARLDWIIARALLTGEVIRDEEVEYADANDSWRTVSVSATPVDEHVVITFTDVTDRNHAREWEPVMRSLSRL